jgi:hypothetical protein
MLAVRCLSPVPTSQRRSGVIFGSLACDACASAAHLGIQSFLINVFRLLCAASAQRHRVRLLCTVVARAVVVSQRRLLYLGGCGLCLRLWLHLTCI